MTTVGLTARRHRFRMRPPPSGRVRKLLWQHPEAPLAGAAVLAWVALAVDHWANHDVSLTHRFDPAAWVLMVIAMMVPAVLPMGRYVAFNSLWRRRYRSLAWFATSYVGLWVALGAAAWAVVVLVERATSTTYVPNGFAVAAMGCVAVAWQLTPTKLRALRRCHLRLPLGARGWSANRMAMRYGIAHGWACVGSCWAIMGLMFVAQHDFHLMVPLAAVTVIERYQRRPRSVPSAAAITLAVVLVSI